eukprot:jgi/Ulvmu1/9543/UM053_0032.1
MRITRQLLRAASDVAVGKGSAIPAPHYFEPASKSPSPLPDLVIGTCVGLAFAATYKVAYWNWKKELNQFYYDYNKVMAEESG